MTATNVESQQRARWMSRFDCGGLLRVVTFSGPHGGYDEPQATAVPGAQEAGRTHICLDCALPLQTQVQNMPPGCHCRPFAETDEDWLAVSGVERLFILGLALACAVIGVWFWL
jgi:hypothetical protein